ncbi:MAG: L,D-transpeptidase family protein [Tatlockia sp.]|nr:L,D-transpeptidase family protein [Tatlockia sp.]
MSSSRLLWAVLLCILSNNCCSTTFVLPAKGDLVGEIQFAYSEIGETLVDVGLNYDIGYEEMLRANPNLNPQIPLPPDTVLLVPSQYILPPGLRQGLVINLAEYRLYYYPSNENVVITMPVGIGRKGWLTPLGLTKIIQKERDPIWHPTAALLAEAAKKGSPLPNSFPSGEANPLGRHSLRLGWPTFLLHGTNRREGVGSRVSAGCLRMLPEDIEYLYKFIPVGTSVRIINERFKFGFQNGAFYMQAHPSLDEQKPKKLNELAREKLAKIIKINPGLVKGELMRPTGLVRKLS